MFLKLAENVQKEIAFPFGDKYTDEDLFCVLALKEQKKRRNFTFKSIKKLKPKKGKTKRKQVVNQKLLPVQKTNQKQQNQ